MKDEDKAKVASEVGAGAVAAAAGALVPGANVVIAIGSPFFVTAAGLLAKKKVGELVSASMNSRYSIWMENIAAAQEFGTEERVEEEVFEHVDESWARDGLLESFRHLFEAIDEGVVPLIARLSADYLGKKQPPTSFHRDLGKLLASVDQAVLPALESVLLYAESRIVGDGGVELHIMQIEDDSYVVSVREGDRLQDTPRVACLGYEHRVFKLLKDSGIGQSGSAGYLGSVSGPHVVILSAAAIRRVVGILYQSQPS